MRQACLPSRFWAPFWISLLPIALQAPSSSPAFVQTSEGKVPAKPAAAVREEMISIATQIVRASESLSQIWPGYWPEDQAFIIHAEDVGALLVSPGARPASFEPIHEYGLPQELKGRSYFHTGTLPGGSSRPFVIGHPIGEGKTALLANLNPHDPVRTITLILHEQFHGYQADAFKGREQQFVDPLAVKDRVAFAASADLERNILAAALTAPTTRKQRDLVKQYFAVRREREGTMPPEVVKVEQGFERLEGTARYVDVLGRSVVAGGGEAQSLSLLKEELQRDLAGESGAFSTIWFRSRGYGTGAALTYLISKMAGPSWRKEIEAGAKLDQMLEALVEEVPQKRRTNLASAARKRFGYESKRRELAPLIQAAERSEIKSVEEFLALAPYHVVLHPGAAGASARPGFAARDMTLLSLTRTALPMAMRFHVAGESFSITSQNTPVLMESGRSRSFTIGLKSAPFIEEIGVLSPGEHRLKSIRVTGDKFELKVGTPVTVQIESNRMIVKLAT